MIPFNKIPKGLRASLFLGELAIDGWMFDMPQEKWIVNCSDITVNNGKAHYNAYKKSQRDNYDSYADLDLTEAIVRALHDSDIQQLQAVIDAVNELTGVTDWQWEINNNRIIYFDPNNPPRNGFDYFYPYNIDGVGTASWADTPLAASIQINQKKSGDYGAKFDHLVNLGNNDYAMFYYETWQGGKIGTGIQVTLFKRVSTNAPEKPKEQSLDFKSVATKIISNSQSSNHAISLLAEAFLENVAKSICNSDESKQFVKLNELSSQFEQNKILKNTVNR